MRPPAIARDHPGDADSAAEQPGEFLKRGEAVRPADAPPAADHHPRRPQRRAGMLTDGLAGPHVKVAVGQFRLVPLDHRGGFRRGSGRDGVGRDGQQRQAGLEHGVLKQAAGPALPGQPAHPRRCPGRADAIRRHRLAGDRTQVGEHFIATVGRGSHDRACPDRPG